MNSETANDRLALAVAERMLALEGTGPAWNLCIEQAGVGRSRVSMIVTDTMLNGHGSAHGGMIFALADTAFAYACNSRNVRAVAQSASIVFLNPAGRGEKLTAEAREEALAGRGGVYSVTVKGKDERVVAIFHGMSRSVGGAVVEQPEAENAGDQTARRP